jgi:hypothetical protein
VQNLKDFQGESRNHFDTKIHTEQIRAYFPLLNQKAIDLINESQDRTDSLIPIYGDQYTNTYHFDNNKYSESTAKINKAIGNCSKLFPVNPIKYFVFWQNHPCASGFLFAFLICLCVKVVKMNLLR